MDNKITLNHLLYQIIEFASSGSLPNDFDITPELATQWVDEVRAVVIGQSLNKKDMINDSVIQYFCVDLEQKDSSECCGETTGCYLLRSKQRLPSTIDTYLDNWLVSVTTIGGEVITKSNPVRQRWSQYNKYTKTQRCWWIKDDYLFIKNDQFLDKVSASGILEHPLDVCRFTCDDEPCMNADSDYPVSLTIANQIVDIIIKTKIQPYLAFPQDNSHDNSNIRKNNISE